jgi:DNA-binding transcriptional regulator LsrR (DeoR family)
MCDCTLGIHSMIDFAEHDLLAQVASLYYEDELTQDAIANQLGLSRVKVYRLLKQARAGQIIQFTIDWPIQRSSELEAALCQQFGLREVFVLRTPAGAQAHALSRLGQLGARFLERTLQDGMTLTVCLGRSTYEVIHAIRPGFQARVDVAQALGSLPFAVPELDSAALARQLAQKLGGNVLYLSAPLMADSVEAAEVMRSQRDIQRSLHAARGAQVGLVGVGDLAPETSEFVRAGAMNMEDLARLRAGGAVGDMAGQIFNIDGELLETDYNRRVIGVDLADLRRIPTVMAAAMGREKAEAILGALRTGVIDVLCTDSEVAGAILEMTQ